MFWGVREHRCIGIQEDMNTSLTDTGKNSMERGEKILVENTRNQIPVTHPKKANDHAKTAVLLNGSGPCCHAMNLHTNVCAIYVTVPSVAPGDGRHSPVISSLHGILYNERPPKPAMMLGPFALKGLSCKLLNPG